MRNKIKKQRKIIMISIISLTLLLSVGYAAFSTNIVLKGKGNIKEKSRVIQSWTSGSNTDFHNSEYRENILSITFLDTAKVPSNTIKSWDVSEARDKGVMAYVTINEEDNTKYDLYIGAKDGVIANQNSAYLFFSFTSLKSINFNNNFDTSNAENMRGIFMNSNKLTNLDLSSFDTSNVTNMANMFDLCSSIEEINISNFNTSKVTNMLAMFSQMYALKSLNLENFNTSNVSNMQWMFNRLDSITYLDLSSFDTSSVTNMNSMFTNSSKLSRIYVSNKFITDSVIEDISDENTHLFNNNISLVGGNGTTYSSSHIDKEYARIDTAETPGYFTLKTE